eukprot:TRINITY_DN15845_c0_g1_i1.p2 TRINITY_DN15845_c0_g1~~TRINITY_DN15845_c0_g1_i1.p2  ORF type:complete len:198 (-),score=42.50 TRINITY_DN15845_c0_g1_i1:2094-2687(-)
MTGLQEKRSTQASASTIVAESSNGTRETVKKRMTMTVRRANGLKDKEKRVFTLPGQKHDPPEERDPLRVFYESLREQIPSSDMAELWMMEHGLLSADDAKTAFAKKQGRSKFGTPVKASIKVKAEVRSEVKSEVQGNGSKGKTVVKAEVKTEVKAEVSSANGSKTRVAVPKARRKLDKSDSDEDFIATRKAKVRKRE